ncbi:hypothetical protein EWB00_008779 [Schistosoma japonicum]|uniref:Uncharacterized protein n=1 Tax=Schistosoma japonicum TaxID=6182 RepID=A0A4Z2CNX4_SCHJA|nr:hypothetical protein EWB00_008779 [Schistosoma japonicum]
MSCIIVLFLMNIVAVISTIPYFIHEMTNLRLPTNPTVKQFNIQNKSLYIEQMKFQVEVHGKKFNTVGLSSSGRLL